MMDVVAERCAPTVGEPPAHEIGNSALRKELEKTKVMKIVSNKNTDWVIRKEIGGRASCTRKNASEASNARLGTVREPWARKKAFSRPAAGPTETAGSSRACALHAVGVVPDRLAHEVDAAVQVLVALLELDLLPPRGDRAAA